MKESVRLIMHMERSWMRMKFRERSISYMSGSSRWNLLIRKYVSEKIKNIMNLEITGRSERLFRVLWII